MIRVTTSMQPEPLRDGLGLSEVRRETAKKVGSH